MAIVQLVRDMKDANTVHVYTEHINLVQHHICSIAIESVADLFYVPDRDVVLELLKTGSIWVSYTSQIEAES